MKAGNRLMDTMVNRTMKGITLEKDGNHGRAAELYEANLADRFDGSHPYERLRIIEKSEGKLHEVVRVCQAFICPPCNNPELKEKYRGIIAKVNEAPSK